MPGPGPVPPTLGPHVVASDPQKAPGPILDFLYHPFKQGGRPNKLRCASTEDSHCHGLPLDPPSRAPPLDTWSSTLAV
jgi:hypothetical protein